MSEREWLGALISLPGGHTELTAKRQLLSASTLFSQKAVEGLRC